MGRADLHIHTRASDGELSPTALVRAAADGRLDVIAVTDHDTIGGLVAHALGRVPRRGEAVPLGSLVFTVMLTRGGAVRWFKVTRAPEVAVGTDGA